MSELYSGTESAVKCGGKRESAVKKMPRSGHTGLRTSSVRPDLTKHDTQEKSLTYFQLLLEFVRGVYWPHTFQHLYGLDSGEDVREIKLQCIVWECQDIGP